ncbi:MAG TPA: cardiolipin synthase [Tepidisphaeraceae bacterium]|nr:cardiolipin synthase [Tepidisphaeraceae bacterium]
MVHVSWLIIYVSIGWIIRAAMVPVILRRQFAPGAAVAWLLIIFLHPYIGGTLYMLVGETRLGPHRTDRHRELMKHYRGAPELIKKGHDEIRKLAPAYEPMVLQAEKISDMPVVPGSSVEYIGDSNLMIDRLVADIDAAKGHVHLLYYIFAPDESGRKVADALMRARARGVACRVLADAVASRAFFHLTGLAAPLKRAGVEIAAALPVAPIQRRLPRMDLRNHRKLALIDDVVAYCGSHNLINADYGGRKGAPWVDLSARFTGPVVRELAIVFAEDWAFETDIHLEAPPLADRPLASEGALMQVVPTGPTSAGENYRRVLLAALQCARKRVTLTAPYFVPDDPTLVALQMAADRGVDVNLLVPLVVDHFFTGAAGRAHFGRLLGSGVRIFQYRPGLLHGKTAVIDESLALIGSANLDVRSFNLNFELTVLIYDREAAGRLAGIHQQYIADSSPIDPQKWYSRPALVRYGESALSLLSPLL